MKLAIVHNQPVREGETNWESSVDILAQIEAIEASLLELKQNVVRIPFTRDLAGFFQQIREQKISGVINLCESVDDDPLLIGHPAAVLELMGVAFTGSTARALIISTDKLLSKKLLQASSIRTPSYFYYDGGKAPQSLDLIFPLIMKPRWQDASIGIDQESVILNSKGIHQTLEQFHARYGPLIVEEYLDGREFNISLMGYPLTRTMPLAEIDFNGYPADLHRLVGYRAKWDESSVEYRTTRRIFPDNLPVSLARNIRRIARECFQLFDLQDYGRVDIRLDSRGRVHVLEINANPCLSPDAGFAAAAAKSGLSYTDMIRDFLVFLKERSDK